MPRISVLMSVYNGARYLEAALESILSQTFPDFEFIIVDDGCTDETPTILDRCADPRVVRLRNETNLGLQKSLNRGLGVTQGKYVARQDADDFSLPHRFERQLAAMEENPDWAAVFPAFERIDEGENGLGIVRPPDTPQAIREHLFYDCRLGHGSAMMRGNALEKIGGYDTSYDTAEDLDLWLRLSEHYPLGSIPAVLYRYRVHGGSITSRRWEVLHHTATRARLTAFNRCGGVGLSPRTVSMFHFTVGLHALSQGDSAEAASRFSLSASPGAEVNEVAEELLSLAISTAVALGSVDRGPSFSSQNVSVASGFLRALLSCLPDAHFAYLRGNLFAEFHAALAYLASTERLPGHTVAHVLRSWWMGPRHRRNRGMLRMVYDSFAPDILSRRSACT